MSERKRRAFRAEDTPPELISQLEAELRASNRTDIHIETPLESMLGTIDLMEKHLAYLRNMALKLAARTNAEPATVNEART